MPAGRPRIPTKLHILHGNPGRRPLNDEEPEPEIKIPEPPTTLGPVALAEWKRITAELFPLGLISELDRTALEIYCDSYEQYQEAKEKTKGVAAVVTIKTENHPNGYPIQNPWYSVLKKEVDTCVKIMTEYGMTAAARSRLRVEKKEPSKQAGAKRFLA